MNLRSGGLFPLMMVGLSSIALLSAGSETRSRRCRGLVTSGSGRSPYLRRRWRITALKDGLRDLGHVEGRDYVLDVRIANTDRHYLTLNAKIASALSITIPATILSQADVLK